MVTTLNAKAASPQKLAAPIHHRNTNTPDSERLAMNSVSQPATQDQTEKDVLNGIRDALETRNFFHMANGRDIGLLLDQANEEIARLKLSNEGLESLRPVWAFGHSDASMTAQAATTALAGLWQMLGVKNQTEAVVAVRAARADTERLNFLERSAKQSRTGVSLDWIPSIEGERSGYRYMRHHSIGEPRNDARTAIDIAMAAATK